MNRFILILLLLLVIPISASAEKSRGGKRFIVWDGTVTDNKTGLMWAIRDNGRDINWHEAKEYCRQYTVGGYTDWRLPSHKELASLFDKKMRNKQGYRLTPLIDLSSCCPWAIESRDSEGAVFGFFYGFRNWYPKTNTDSTRALPVRSVRFRHFRK